MAHVARKLGVEEIRANRWLAEFTAAMRDGRPVTPEQRVAVFRRFVAAGRLESTEPLLPLVLNLKGKPYALGDHFAFGPMFRTRMPQKLVLICGRQVSKSTSQAAAGLIFANSVPHRTQLFITPLFEQIRRFSSNYVGDFIDGSPVKRLWSDTTTNNSVLQRSFKNRSKMIFSFACDSADRVRGVTSDVCAFDEVQDLDREHIPIIEETMSFSDWNISRYTGTPKSLDNTIERYWSRSSQAQWVVPCYACGYENVPANSHDLHDMIGPWRPDISEHAPATICARKSCRRPVNPRLGRWRHLHPERRWGFAGYHVPQIILPHHYAKPEKWEILLGKRDNLSAAVFNNEVLGESYDVGAKLVSESDLKAAAVLPWENRPEDPDPAVFERLDHYAARVLAVDWGGGGKEGVSYTTLALLGWRSDGVIDVVWGRRLLTPHDHLREAQEVRDAAARLKAQFIVHDYTGAGSLRETFLVQSGVPIGRIMPVAYVGAAAHATFRHVPASPTHPRSHYQADKTRTLLTTTTCLRRGRLRTFAYDYKNEDAPGLLADFLALFDEKVETARAGDIYTIRRQEGFPDDFAQAVNIGCCALWHYHDAWPDLAKLAGVASVVTPDQLRAAVGDRELEWEDHMDGFLATP